MTDSPFLRRYEVRHDIEQPMAETYDPKLMILVRDGKPAVDDPTFVERGTVITKVSRETTDDR